LEKKVREFAIENMELQYPSLRVIMEDLEVRGLEEIEDRFLDSPVGFSLYTPRNQPLGYLPGSIALSGCRGPKIDLDGVEESSLG
jgi:hypothetical protein